MEDGASSRNLVIKVKYGDSLRRFSARVNGSSIDHDMSILRSKIISLFTFTPDADLILQYTDVDGDLVTFETDEELRDAIINQCLNPLRITVQLNHNTETRSEPTDPIHLSGVSAELSTLQDQINFTVKEALKSVPEPVQDALSNLSHNILSKAATSSPIFTDIVEHFSKLGLSNHYPSQSFSSETSGSRADGASNQSDLNFGNTGNSPVAPGDRLLDVTLVQQGNSDDNMPKNLGQFEVVRTSPTLQPETSNFINTDSIAVGASTGDGGLETHKEDANPMNLPTGLLPVPDVCQGIDFQVNKAPASGTVSGITMERGNSEQPPAGLNSGSSENGLINTQAVGSSLQTAVSDGSPWPFISYGRRHNMQHNLSPAVHLNVVCDGCGIQPIVGPRYQSKAKHDYDLCEFCFSKMGHDNEYVRIDQATMPYRSPRPFGGCYSNPHAFRGPRMRSHRAKLESRFIQDVTVMDGTLVAPSTPFTKIWRMHNNGAIPWPRGTQLLWIGGDHIANRSFVELEVPENGFPVNTEVDIAVDCIAPSMPGRYTSFWRLATPFGQKFGQRIWVQIQVDTGHGPTASAFGYPTEVDMNIYHPNQQGLSWMAGAPFGPIGNNYMNFPDFGLSAGPTKHVGRTKDDRSFETDNIPTASSKSAQVVPVVSGATPTNLYPIVATETTGSTPETTTSDGSYTAVDLSVVPPASEIPPAPKSVPLPPLSTTESAPLVPLPVLVPTPLSVSVPKNGGVSAAALENQHGKTVPMPSASAETILPPPLMPEIVSVPFPPAPESVSVNHSPRPAPNSSYPLIDPAPSSSITPQSASVLPSEPTPDSDLELLLLKGLEGMGFREVEVNKEMLRKNEYDFEKTIDDLCGISEWDPLLNELRDMGFWDEELNKKLLIKNDGSIKRVVLDLINGKTK